MDKTKQTNNIVTTTDNEKLWKRFKSYFWALFLIHLIPKGFSAIEVTTDEQATGLFVVALGITLIAALGMVINVGLHAYFFSKKKIYVLFGLLGLWWAGVVGIFIAYFAVQWVYYKSTNKIFPLSTKIIAGLLVVISLLIMSSLGSAFLISTDSTNSTSQTQEWTTITTPDGRLAMFLPRNPTYEYTKAGNAKVEGYSYIAEEYDGKVIYIVKYENWQSIASREGIEIKSLDDERLRALLKANVDLEIEEFDVSNFVSEFTSSHGYRAIRFDGQIKEGNSIAGIQGICMFVEGHLYTFIALADSGYSADLERLLNSISFNSLGL